MDGGVSENTRGERRTGQRRNRGSEGHVGGVEGSARSGGEEVGRHGGVL